MYTYGYTVTINNIRPYLWSNNLTFNVFLKQLAVANLKIERSLFSTKYFIVYPVNFNFSDMSTDKNIFHHVYLLALIKNGFSIIKTYSDEIRSHIFQDMGSIPISIINIDRNLVVGFGWLSHVIKMKSCLKKSFNIDTITQRLQDLNLSLFYGNKKDDYVFLASHFQKIPSRTEIRELDLNTICPTWQQFEILFKIVHDKKYVNFNGGCGLGIHFKIVN